MSTRLQKLWVSVENEDSATYGASEVVDVSDVIENEETIEEADELNDEIEDHVESLDVASEEGEELVEIVEHNEEILNNPEEKSEEEVEKAVEVSQEALHDTYLILYGKKYRDSNRLSLEHLETNIEKLRYSTEAIKDVALNIWEQIKRLFLKFIQFFKTWTNKILSWFAGTGPKIKNIIKNIEDSFDPSKIKSNSDVEKTISERLEDRFPAFFHVAYSLDKSKTALKDILQSLNASVEAKDDSVNKSANAEPKQHDPNSTTTPGEGKSSAESSDTEAAIVIFDDKNLNSKTEKVKDVIKGTEIDFDRDGEEPVFFYLTSPRTIHAISNYGRSGSDRLDDNLESGVRDFIEKFIKQNTSVSSLIAGLNEVANISKKTSKLVNNSYKNFDKFIKRLDKIHKDDLKSSFDYEDKVYFRQVYNRSYSAYAKIASYTISEVKSITSVTLGVANVFLSNGRNYNKKK